MPKTYDLVINFNYPHSFNTDNEINFTTHRDNSSKIILPIAAWSENSGTLTNEDDITQVCKKVTNKNNPLPTIIEYLQRLRK